MRVEILDVSAPDGTVCKAALALPDGEGPFPAVLLVHGGMGGLYPEEELAAFAGGEEFNGRRFVEKGWAVMASDYRHPSHGAGEIDDTVAAYHALCEHPQVNADRVAMVGTSHGAVCILLTGARVKPACIVAEEGAADFAERYNTLYEQLREAGDELTEYQKLDKELFDELAARLGGTPDDVPKAFEATSPYSQAAKIDSPMLIVSGDGLYAPHCRRMHEAMLQAGKDCRLEPYENAPHAFWWFRKEIPAFPQADKDIFAFLSKHLEP